MKPVSGLCASDRALERPEAGEMKLGPQIALVEGKEPLLPWGQSGL